MRGRDGGNSSCDYVATYKLEILYQDQLTDIAKPRKSISLSIYDQESLK